MATLPRLSMVTRFEGGVNCCPSDVSHFRLEMEEKLPCHLPSIHGTLSLFFNVCYACMYVYLDLHNQPWHRSLPAWIAAFLAWSLPNFCFALVMDAIEAKLRSRRAERGVKLSVACGPFERAMGRFMAGRQFCITEGGYMGWVHTSAEVGDLICKFEGCRIPFTIRPQESGYRLIGDAYVHGMMDSETLESMHGARERIQLV